MMSSHNVSSNKNVNENNTAATPKSDSFFIVEKPAEADDNSNNNNNILNTNKNDGRFANLRSRYLTANSPNNVDDAVGNNSEKKKVSDYDGNGSVSHATQNESSSSSSSFITSFGIPLVIYPAYVVTTFPSASHHFKKHFLYTEDPAVGIPLKKEESRRFEPLWDRRRFVLSEADRNRHDAADIRRLTRLQNRQLKAKHYNEKVALRAKNHEVLYADIKSTYFGFTAAIYPAYIVTTFPSASHYFKHHRLYTEDPATALLPEEEVKRRFIPLYDRRDEICAVEDAKRMRNAIANRENILLARKNRLAKQDESRKERVRLMKKQKEVRKH